MCVTAGIWGYLHIRGGFKHWLLTMDEHQLWKTGLLGMFLTSLYPFSALFNISFLFFFFAVFS